MARPGAARMATIATVSAHESARNTAYESMGSVVPLVFAPMADEGWWGSARPAYRVINAETGVVVITDFLSNPTEDSNVGTGVEVMLWAPEFGGRNGFPPPGKDWARAFY